MQSRTRQRNADRNPPCSFLIRLSHPPFRPAFVTRLALAQSFGFEMLHTEVTSLSRHLANSSSPALRVMELSHNKLLVDRAFHGILARIGHTRLEGSLAGTLAEVEASCRHLAVSRWPKLVRLNLSQHPLSPASVTSLLSRQWSAMRTLSLQKCFDFDAQRRRQHPSLLQSPYKCRVTIIDKSGYWIQHDQDNV